MRRTDFEMLGTAQLIFDSFVRHQRTSSASLTAGELVALHGLFTTLGALTEGQIRKLLGDYHHSLLQLTQRPIWSRPLL